MSRDLGGGCGEAVTRALPGAVHIADHWHLLKLKTAALNPGSRAPVNARRPRCLAATTVDPVLLTAAERRQSPTHQGLLRREDTTLQILAILAKEAGHSI